MSLGSRLRVGVIGVGAMGANHVRVYANMTDVDLAGVADVNPDTARRVASAYGCPAFSDHLALLDAGVDAVSVAVPTSLHLPICCSTLEHGIHTLVEKPIADSVEASLFLSRLAIKSQSTLMVGHIERFNPAVRRLTEIVHQGQLGKIVSMSARRVGPFNPRVSDVGIILDLAPHDIDIMSSLVRSRVGRVYASAGNVRHNNEDHAIVVMEFGEGCTGVIETNWLTPHKVRTLTVVGSQGIAVVDYLSVSLHIFEEGWERTATLEKAEPLRLELETFIRCARSGECPPVTAEDGTHAVAVARAASSSAQCGRPQTLEPFS